VHMPVVITPWCYYSTLQFFNFLALVLIIKKQDILAHRVTTCSDIGYKKDISGYTYTLSLDCRMLICILHICRFQAFQTIPNFIQKFIPVDFTLTRRKANL
jgi:hypothetical protein